MRHNFRIFLVEDDPWYGQILKHHLSMNEDYEIHLFETARECLNNLYLKPDLLCVDYGLPDMKGDALLAELIHWNQNIPVIIISAQEEIKVAVNLLKAGAREYLVKDNNTTDLLWRSILHIRETLVLKIEVEELKTELRKNYSVNKYMIGESEPLQKVTRLIDKAIKSNINVSITGETGTGKEVVAKSIHFNSDRKKMPFIAVNMAAIPMELIESELFGYEKGAFTGANTKRSGKFQDADGGTLFLDEICEMDLSLQSKLLRVLQEREVVPLGSSKKLKVDVRIITATNRNLAEEVRNGNFREDLYFRIIGLPIDLPPLRERGNDVVLLAKTFINEYAADNHVNPPVLGKDAIEKLLSYNYPGNVRELKAIMELSCIMCSDERITADDIVFHNLNNKGVSYAEEKTLREYEADIINEYLKKYNHDVLLVAEKLNISKSSIYSMIKSGILDAKK